MLIYWGKITESGLLQTTIRNDSFFWWGKLMEIVF